MIGPARRPLILATGAALAILAGQAGAVEARRVTIRGNGHDLGETPIVVPIEAVISAGSYRLRSNGRSMDRPARVFEDQGKTYLGVVLERLGGDERAEFSLEPDSPDRRQPPGVEFRPAGANVWVFNGGRLLTEYLSDVGAKPVLYPLIGPTGAPVTRSFPRRKIAEEDYDHPHQVSFWFTHGKVNGIDFWSIERGHGTIRELSRESTGSGPAVGLIRTRNEWRGPDGKVLCEDERRYGFYETRSVRIIDLDVTIRANHGPVTFGDTKEGTFGLRVASSMDVNRKGGGQITNAEGTTDLKAWGKASPWVDYTGPVEGQTVGIAILNHPESFRYPTTWHVRDYGLFAANPFGWHDFGLGKSGDHTIPDGESIRLRYRVILHEGTTREADIPAAFHAFAEPPTIVLGK